MGSVQQWTGREARALRHALRMSFRDFAAHFGIGQRTVSKWEALGERTVPRPVMQSVLDSILDEADEDVRVRFRQNLWGSAESEVQVRYHDGGVDYEWWSDDLDRCLVFLSRQEFSSAKAVIDRWMWKFTPDSNNAKGMYLYGRSLRLLGDIQQDQGIVDGSESAEVKYRRALAVFKELDMPRRVAQVEMQLTVVQEMSGNLAIAAERYRMLANDHRLDESDRARAQLWIGTALSKLGQNDAAANHILPSIHSFEKLNEPSDWSIAHQKLALAYRGAGKLKAANHHIGVALAHRQTDVPMQQVRLGTAHAHILLSDAATSRECLAILTKTARLSTQYGLRHQLQSIEGIRSRFERGPVRPQVSS